MFSDKDLDKMVRNALRDFENEKEKQAAQSIYQTMAEHTAMMVNAFASVGFSREEAYEMASNIILMQVQGAIDHPMFYTTKKKEK